MCASGSLMGRDRPKARAGNGGAALTWEFGGSFTVPHPSSRKGSKPPSMKGREESAPLGELQRRQSAGGSQRASRASVIDLRDQRRKT